MLYRYITVSYTHLDVYKRQLEQPLSKVVDENQTTGNSTLLFLMPYRSLVHDTTSMIPQN